MSQAPRNWNLPKSLVHTLPNPHPPAHWYCPCLCLHRTPQLQACWCTPSKCVPFAWIPSFIIATPWHPYLLALLRALFNVRCLSLGCYSKLPYAGGDFHDKCLFLIALGARKSRMDMPADSLCAETLCGWLPSFYILTHWRKRSALSSSPSPSSSSFSSSSFLSSVSSY